MIGNIKNEEEWRKVFHELRNPLNTITMNTDLAKLCLQSDLKAAEQALKVVSAECEKLNQKIIALESDVKNQC